MAGSSPSLKHQIGEEYGRVSYTFTAPSHESYTYYTIYIGASGEHNVEGTLWVDCIQLEEGAAPSHYNLIENSDFGWATYADPSGEGIGTPNFWTKLAHATADDGALSSFPAHAEGARALPSTSCLRMQGSYAKSNMGFYQDLPLSGAKDDVFVLGGWAKAISIARRTAKKHFGLRLSFLSGTNTYTDATSEVQWNAEWTSWQYTFGPVIAPKAYTGVRVYIDYCRNENEALFTNLFLYKDTFGWSYKYDANGNLLSATGLNKQASQATYDASHNLTKYTAPGATASTLLEYALGAKKHLVTKITSPMAVITEYEYDSVGNRTSSKVSCATASEGFIQSMVTYDDNKNHAISAKDARGFIIRKEVDPTTDLLKSVTDPLGQQVGYTYDTRRRMTAAGAMACNKYHANSYTYEYDRLVEASHNTTDNRQNDVVYRFAYNDFGNQTSVSVGDQVLSTSVYAQDDPRMLDGVDYGNGGQVRYQRDHLKRITGVTWDGGATPDYETIYNSNGNPALTKDHALNRETRTEFDLCERPMRTITTEAGQPLHEYQVAYDTTNRVETMKEFLDGEQKFAASFAYDKGGRPTALTYTEGTATKDRLEITYDKLGRTSARKLKQTGKTDYTVSYKYAAGGHGALSTTGLISEIILPGETIKYTYDERGNITAETRGTLTTRYQYDALGQLIRVDDPHAELTTTFMYDRGGNILCKTEYAYTPGTYLLPPEDRTVHYTYGDAAWKDKLTAYDGVPITYDAIGNPLNDGKWTYTWQHGRQLAAITSEDDSISFQYNSAGLRVRKTSASRGTTEYTLRGTQVVRLQRSNVDMHFWYDECGHPTLVKYGDSYYGYEYNVQGDVIGLVDRASSNARAVRYAYDAWGRPVSCTGDLAETLGKENPFRYRGYLFDEETGWYALHARYYLPEQARFLNTDIILGNVGRLFTHNVFTYCYNNPANLYDPSGMTPQWTDPKYIAAMEEHARKLLEKIEKDKASAAKKSNSGGNGNSKASVGAANISNESTQTLLDSWQDAIDRKFKKDLEIIAAAQASPKLMERHFPDWYEKARAEQQAQEEEAYRLAHEEEERKAAIWGALQEGMDNTNTRFRNVFDFFGTSHFEDQSDMLPEHQIMPSSPYR